MIVTQELALEVERDILIAEISGVAISALTPVPAFANHDTTTDDTYRNILTSR